MNEKIQSTENAPSNYLRPVAFDINPAVWRNRTDLNNDTYIILEILYHYYKTQTTLPYDLMLEYIEIISEVCNTDGLSDIKKLDIDVYFQEAFKNVSKILQPLLHDSSSETTTTDDDDDNNNN